MTDTQLAIADSDIKVLENLMPTMPDHIETLQDAVATMIVARELGLAPLSAFPDLMIINGAVGMTSKLMLALVLKAGHKSVVREMTDEKAVIEGFRKFDGEWESVGLFEFTEDDAIQANLMPKDTYQLYPADMLMNKAVARMVRFGFPDVIRGYVPDEIEDITGVTFPHDAHLGPLEEVIDAEEVAEILEGEIVDEA